MPKGHDHPWTCRELHRLEQLRLDGLTARAIAHHLGRTRDSVRGALCRANIRKPSWLLRWLPELSVPRTNREHAVRMGTTVHGVKRARRLLRQKGLL